MRIVHCPFPKPIPTRREIPHPRPHSLVFLNMQNVCNITLIDYLQLI